MLPAAHRRKSKIAVGFGQVAGALCAIQVSRHSIDLANSGGRDRLGKVARIIADTPTGHGRTATALTVPFFRLPGCPVSAWTLFEDGRTDYRWLSPHRDSGLTVSPSVLADETSEDVLVLVDNVPLYLQLLDTGLRAGAGLLPLAVISQPEKAKQLCNWLEKPLIIWSPQTSRAHLAAAIRLNARVLSDQDFPLDRRLLSRPASFLMSQAVAAARPWQEALGEFAYQRSLPELQALADAAHWSFERYREVREYLPETARQRLDALYSGQARRVFQLDSTLFEESGGAWRANNKLLCDAIVRVDRITAPTDSRLPIVYEGRVLAGGRVLPFRGLAHELARNPGQWLGELLTRHGFMPPPAVRALRRLFDLALVFHAPQIINSSPACGWSPEDSCFWISDFAITTRGVVKEGLMLPPATIASPTQALRRPAYVNCEDVRKLREHTDEAACAWVAITWMIANILTPALNAQCVGLALASKYRPAPMLACLERLGIGVWRPEPDTTAEVLKNLDNVLYERNWPVLVDTTLTRQASKVAKLLGEFKEPGCAAVVDVYGSLALTMTGNWHALHVPETMTVDYTLYDAAAKVIPAYLQWLGQQRLRLPRSTCHLYAVAKSLADWFETIGGAGERIVDAIENLFWLASKDNQAITERFFDLVALAARDRRANDGRRITDGTRHAHRWLNISPEVLINGLDDSAAVSILDPLILESTLRAEGAIVAILPTRNDRRQWRVERRRWREELRRRYAS